MQPRPIAQAPKTATILANFGNVLCIAKWNPDKGRRPRPFWDPSPRLASPYIESWVRTHQPTEFRDVAEILAPTPPVLGGGLHIQFAPGEIKQHPKLLVNDAPASFEVEEIVRDATGLREALFRGLTVKLPAKIDFEDSATAPPPITS